MLSDAPWIMLLDGAVLTPASRAPEPESESGRFQGQQGIYLAVLSLPSVDHNMRSLLRAWAALGHCRCITEIHPGIHDHVWFLLSGSHCRLVSSENIPQ